MEVCGSNPPGGFRKYVVIYGGKVADTLVLKEGGNLLEGARGFTRQPPSRLRDRLRPRPRLRLLSLPIKQWQWPMTGLRGAL